MPIKFACEHCGQRLNVSSKQAGVRAKCPKCKGKIQVPEANGEASNEPDEVVGDGDASRPAGAASEEENPYAEFVVYDDEVEWHYESDDNDYAPRLSTATDLDRVAVPRRVLYAQGILLAVVAIVSFILGTLVTGGGSKEAADVGPVPCQLSGEVVYATGGGRNLPDDGSIVLVLPQDQRPAPTGKAPIEGLRPGDPLPLGESENLRIIQSIGGAYARTDNAGRFQLTLPDHGQYFVLIVSKNKYRAPGEERDKADIAQLGNYVLTPTELLGESKYEWRVVTIRKNESLDLTF
jgi:phage FluMu protein Com